MPRLPALLTALAVTVATALSALPGLPAASAEPAPAITWSACTSQQLAWSGLQCGSLAVPLDHAHPDGPTVRLALTRRVHTGATYRGVMLVNPGGPGASGRSLATLGDYVPGGAGDAYDWIGFDPRGVGASSPALRCATTYFGTDRPSYVPRKQWQTRYWLAKSRAYAASCADTAAERALLPHLTSLDTVRDMDAIRAALGQETISYYGFSYGTYLGQLYATRYPARVGRFVLDGVVDPTRTWYAANLDQDLAFETAIDAFWRYLAANPRTFHLGKRWRAIKRGHARLLRSLDRRPAAGRRIGPAELTDVLTGAAYGVQDWPTIGQAYAHLKKQRRGGEVLALFRESQASDTASFGGYNAVECTDAPWPTWARVSADARALHRRAPFLTWSNTWYNAPCLSWRAPRHARPAVSGRAVTARILLVSETGDAATPYSGALRTRALFPSASLVAGVGGTTHSSSLSGVACVDNAVAAYLRSGVVPTRLAGNRSDRACPRLTPPPPWASFLRTTAGRDRLPPALRRDLRAAQRHG